MKLNRRTPPPPEEIKSHWDIIVLDPTKCFVCGKPLKNSQQTVFVGKYKGIKLSRHRKCDCLSEAWKNKFGKCKTLQQ